MPAPAHAPAPSLRVGPALPDGIVANLVLSLLSLSHRSPGAHTAGIATTIATTFPSSPPHPEHFGSAITAIWVTTGTSVSASPPSQEDPECSVALG